MNFLKKHWLILLFVVAACFIVYELAKTINTLSAGLASFIKALNSFNPLNWFLGPPSSNSSTTTASSAIGNAVGSAANSIGAAAGSAWSSIESALGYTMPDGSTGNPTP
jgi:hypothetical protein